MRSSFLGCLMRGPRESAERSVRSSFLGCLMRGPRESAERSVRSSFLGCLMRGPRESAERSVRSSFVGCSCGLSRACGPGSRSSVAAQPNGPSHVVDGGGHGDYQRHRHDRGGETAPEPVQRQDVEPDRDRLQQRLDLAAAAGRRSPRAGSPRSAAASRRPRGPGSRRSPTTAARPAPTARSGRRRSAPCPRSGRPACRTR